MPRFLLAFVLLLWLPPQCQLPEGRVPGDAPSRADTDQPAVCTIDRVIDGDTVDCAESASNARLLLIDAPEIAQGDDGNASRAALLELLPVGTTARIEYDVSPRDRYQRLLVYLYLPDGRMVNEEMARLGYAVLAIYPPNVRYVDVIRAAAEEARARGRGLWSGSAFECLPADFRADRCG